MNMCPLAILIFFFTPVEFWDPQAVIHVRLFLTNQMVRILTNRKGNWSSNEDRVPV